MDAVNFEAVTQTGGSLFGGCVPIMIGAIGHRTLGDAGKIEEAARKKCRELKRKYPNSPFAVLSPIAEGADRLLTKVAMEELGAKLFAVLPFPQEEYEKDFESSASKDAFRTLLREAAAHVHAFDGGGGALMNVQGEPRNEQYARAGGIIVEQAQILFAVWDGLPAKGTGGTAQQIGWFEQGALPPEFSRVPAEVSPFDPAEPGLLILIDSNSGKAKEVDCAETAYTSVTKVDSKNEAQEVLKEAARTNISKILKRTERFNTDVLSRKKNIDSNLARYPLAPADVRNLFPDAAAAYHSSDAMAMAFGELVRRADIILYSAAVVAVFFFNMLHIWPVASVAYLGIASVIVAVSLCLRQLSFDLRFLEYRGLAEALRVLFFWRLHGLQRQVWLCYLSKHSGVVRWVRQAVRALEFCEAAKAQQPHRPDADALIDEHWLNDQIRYYRNAGNKNWRHFKRWYWVSRIALLLSLAFAVYLAYLRWADAFRWVDEFRWADAFHGKEVRPLVVVIEMLLGISVAIGLASRSFLARRADLELAKQFVSARQTFELAQRSLEKATSEEEARSILERLGREALVEHAEWLWLRHSRPFEMPN